MARRVEPLGAEVGPRLLFQDAAVDLEVPVHLQGLALGIVVSAGQTHARRLARGRFDRFYQPAPRTYLDQLTDTRWSGGQVDRLVSHERYCKLKCACMGSHTRRPEGPHQTFDDRNASV